MISDGDYRRPVEFFEGFQKWPSLIDITLDFRAEDVIVLRDKLLHDERTLKELDHALLAFPKPRFICTLSRPPSTHSSSFWFGELRKHLPSLSQRDAVTLQPLDELGGVFHGFSLRIQLTIHQVFLGAGHDGPVQVLAISPDGKWVASGSSDSTIILWNVDNGTIAQQWVAHGYREIKALAFSPDSQHIVSGGWKSSEATIWDVSQEPRKIAALGEDAPQAADMLQTDSLAGISQCAWSPDGRTIATGSYDGNVRLWAARTFRQ